LRGGENREHGVGGREKRGFSEKRSKVRKSFGRKRGGLKKKKRLPGGRIA